MSKPEKKTYQILVPRHALFEFAVDAETPEAACKLLQRELKVGELKLAKGGSEPVEAYWGQPDDTGEAWMVMRSKPDEVEAYEYILAWNGKEIVDSGFAPLPIKDEVRKKPASAKNRK